MKAIAIVSGGLDSTVMAHDLKSQGLDIDIVSFYYGQRHNKELSYAAMTAQALGARFDVINLEHVGMLLAAGGSVLVDHEAEVPDGHYAEDSMKQTVVPNRNMIMLSIASGIAVARGAITVAIAVHGGDHFIYPDCRPEFISALSSAVDLGNEGFGKLDAESPINAPYIYKTKEDIAFRALELGVPFHMTWSCYKGGEKHCGKCGTCVERLEAIRGAVKRLNGIDAGKYHEIVDANPHINPGMYWDLTEYEDSAFWLRVVEEKA